MTCSSNTTFTPERRRRAGAALLLAAALCGAVPGAATPAGAGESEAGESEAGGLIREAHAALARGDGIAAEMTLRKAMAAGAPRDAVAARMGEALLDQGDLRKAREWLGPARFAPAEAAHGFRVLGRLEMADGDFGAAGRAFDRALALAPRDSRLWVDIARMRYAGGEQVQAVAAADRALQLDPANVRALEFRGLVLRDSLGLTAALPWLEAGLKLRPDDLSLLGEYAATLGELGRARQMLVVTRRMIELDPDNPRAFYLRAVLAARVGNVRLARALLARAGSGAAVMPAGQLLQGMLELQAGNVNRAIELLDRLSRRQPQNRTVRLLLARAIDAGGDRRLLVDTFAAEAARPDASPYLLTLVARAWEDLGERAAAAALLDRAAAAGVRPVQPLPEPVPLGELALRHADNPASPADAVPYVRALLAVGRPGEAGAIAERLRQLAPGSGDAAVVDGDLRLARGDLVGAVEAWRAAAAIRLDDGLLLRLVDVYRRVGRGADAERLVDGLLASRPRNRTALRLAAGFAAERGQWGRAAALLDWLDRAGAGRDARLLADLSLASLRSGDPARAASAGERAYRLQPANGVGAEAWGMALGHADVGSGRSLADALLARARAAHAEKPLSVDAGQGLRRGS